MPEASMLIPFHSHLKYNPLQLLSAELIGQDCNVIVQAPTGAGKTIVAEQFFYPALIEGKRVIYLSPLKALTNEKLEDWERLPYKKIAITSDFDTPSSFDQQMVLMTTESLDSKSRGGKTWLQNVGVLVADESHLLASDGRGDAFEVGLTRFASINKDARIIFLSATFPNTEEVAEWLTILNGKPTKVVSTEWEPVKRTHKLVYGPRPKWQYNSELFSLIRKKMRDNPHKQVLIFVHTIGMGKYISKTLNIPFHYSRLNKGERSELEKKFRERQVPAMVSTSTLAYGVNLPADIGIIAGALRGIAPVDAYDLKQMAGRIGRYGLSVNGEVIYYFQQDIAEDVYSELWNLPDIRSKLINKLYFHICSFIAREGMQLPDIIDFLSRTFGAMQSDLLARIPEAIDILIDHDAIRQYGDTFSATTLGRASAFMYVDPIDLYHWRKNFAERPITPSVIGVAYANVPSFQQSCWIPDDMEEDLIKMNYPLQSFIATSLRDWLDGRDLKDAQSSLIGMHARDFRRIVAAFRMMGFDQAYAKALEAMITQGVGMELIPLVSLKGVGRKKAQDLYRQGITRPQQILESIVARNILGPKGYINACNQMAEKGDKIILVF